MQCLETGAYGKGAAIISTVACTRISVKTLPDFLDFDFLDVMRRMAIGYRERRRVKMRRGLLAIIFGASVLITFSTASAFDVRTGDNLVVSEGEVVYEDLFIAGDTVTIDGSVEGDLYAAARTVIIRGSIRDSATVFASTITVTGSIGHGMHAAAGELTIDGSVKGDVVVAGRTVSLGGDAMIVGDVIAAGQKINVSSPIEGYILGAGRNVSINERVRGDAAFAVGTLTLQENARVGGNLYYVSENEAIIFPGAEIAGRVMHHVPELREKLKGVFPFVIIAGVLGKILSFVMMVVVGLAFVFIAPKWLFRLSETVKRHPGPCAGWGALVLFITPLGIVVSFLTVVGISLAVIVALAYLMALYLSQVVTALLIGRLVLGMKEETAKQGRLFGAFVLGLFLIRLVRFIPGIGIFVWAAVALFGLGAFIVSQMKRATRNAS
jgi:cytoskeletal protein CcmA (bactofilin family)